MAKTTKPKSATSYKQTAFGILSRSKVVQLEAEGVKKAQEYIIKLSRNKVAIAPQLVLDIHKVGFGFIFPDWAGKFRTIDVTVGDYEPPHYSRVSELIKNLKIWYNTGHGAYGILGFQIRPLRTSLTSARRSTSDMMPRIDFYTLNNIN